MPQIITVDGKKYRCIDGEPILKKSSAGKEITVSIGMDDTNLKVKLNEIEKQIDRIIEKQKHIETFRINTIHTGVIESMPMSSAVGLKPLSNNITINMNGSIDTDTVTEHISKSIKLALSNI
ncbi:hypothetical protein [Clostridium sp.]|jgi:hypothetical protein|uniref:hypothetical protein n=1 Tax=Clostridium sp. TaxID=1506 RepID=UPI003EED4CE0